MEPKPESQRGEDLGESFFLLERHRNGAREALVKLLARYEREQLRERCPGSAT